MIRWWITVKKTLHIALQIKYRHKNLQIFRAEMIRNDPNANLRLWSWTWPQLRWSCWAQHKSNYPNARWVLGQSLMNRSTWNSHLHPPLSTKYTNCTRNIPTVYKIYQLYTKYTNCTQNIPTVHKIYQLSTKYTNCIQNIPTVHEIYQLSTKYTNCTQNIPTVYKIYQLYTKYTNCIQNIPTVHKI